MADIRKKDDNQAEMGSRLRSLMKRYPRGLSLSREDLAAIGWLYFYEQETGPQGIPESHLKWLILQAAERLGLNGSALQPSQLIQKLMRLDVLRIAISDSSSEGYRLTCLGRDLARNLLDDTDYDSEQLNVLLNCALGEIESAASEGGGTLLKYLDYIFLGTIREKIEYKLLTIEEDLERRKKEVKQTYSGRDQADFEAAIADIEYCRAALSELVETVQESSGCMKIEELLHDCMLREPGAELYEALEQSLNFTYVLRGRVETMLKGVVQFIRDCIAYRSLAFTVDLRDRLRRIQERILTHALTRDIRMSVLDAPRTPRMDLNWSRQAQERPVLLDLERLRTMEGFLPPAIPLIDPVWKESFLVEAKSEWADAARSGGIELGGWIRSLAEKMPQIEDSPCIALWLLIQDWPKWTPSVTIQRHTGRWVPLGKGWMMEEMRLLPILSNDSGGERAK